MQIVILLLLSFLSGCSSRPRVYDYSWGKIVKADSNTVIKHCAPKKGKWDNGTPRRMWAPVVGCYDSDKNEIWIQDNCAGAKAIIHELGHQDGSKNPKQDGLDWYP